MSFDIVSIKTPKRRKFESTHHHHDEQEMPNIDNLHGHDVLCGRGGASFKHVGNYTFRHLVLLNKEQYAKSKKVEKRKFAMRIVKAIRKQNPPGRFLERNPKTGLYYDVGDRRAVEKTSQALRDHIKNSLQSSESMPPSSSSSTVPVYPSIALNGLQSEFREELTTTGLPTKLNNLPAFNRTVSKDLPSRTTKRNENQLNNFTNIKNDISIISEAVKKRNPNKYELSLLSTVADIFINNA